jgi:hypothetical protein
VGQRAREILRTGRPDQPFEQVGPPAAGRFVGLAPQSAASAASLRRRVRVVADEQHARCDLGADARRLELAGSGLHDQRGKLGDLAVEILVAASEAAQRAPCRGEAVATWAAVHPRAASAPA